MVDIGKSIQDLVEYGIDKGLIEKRDRNYIINRLVGFLDLDTYEEQESHSEASKAVEDILEDFRAWAIENKKVENDSVEALDIFDTEVMSILSKRPSEIEKSFWKHYQTSPKEATDNYYSFAKNINYIREKRIAKDIKWTYGSEYGDIDITINMSKPEKDPRAIAKARTMKASGYPKCALCSENEGYLGNLNQAARGNHRLIEIELAKEQWFLQYSPYVYYNEHCIVLKGEHEPMKISDLTFRRLLEFVSIFPHYFLGSNAGLPIVGGSILSHDHFQGGRYDFAMAKAKEVNTLVLKNEIEASTLKWPMSVIRLKGKDIDALVDSSYKIMKNWESYEDKEAHIIPQSKGEPHNAITPICRFRDGNFEMDLVLRNNRTTEERPYGLFHPREDYHNIKKENIGLIEVLGLAVLPSRLKVEMEDLKPYLLSGNLEAIKDNENLSKHYEFASTLVKKNPISSENIEEVLEEAIGEVFLNVLRDASVFKETKEGQKAFERCREKLLSFAI